MIKKIVLYNLIPGHKFLKFPIFKINHVTESTINSFIFVHFDFIVFVHGEKESVKNSAF